MAENIKNRDIKANMVTPDSVASLPMKWVGPLTVLFTDTAEEVSVPLATYESPLWPSVERGARVTAKAGGISLVHHGACMTRSICCEGESARDALHCAQSITEDESFYAEVVSTSSNYARLKDLQTEVIGKLLYVRIAIDSGDAAGHNMTTKAAEAVLNSILEKYQQLSYVSLSGNFCTDKKVSAVNALLGRGHHLTAEVRIPEKICKKMLRVTPQEIHDLNYKKNFVGSTAAGSLRSANAHYANMLLAFYLATGQDAANIVEGSQGITYTDIQDGDLYFSVNLPNVIVGTVGNGKNLDFVKGNLSQMGCEVSDTSSASTKRLAGLAAATVLCGELSLLAALANQGELVKTHLKLER